MLVLSRKRTEKVWIGSDVRITVLKVDRNQVRLGIEAPGDVTILRAELIEGDEDAYETAAAGRPVRAAVVQG